jgi:hypothetical protein
MSLRETIVLSVLLHHSATKEREIVLSAFLHHSATKMEQWAHMSTRTISSAVLVNVDKRMHNSSQHTFYR